MSSSLRGKSIAFVTSKDYPKLTSSDQIAAEVIRSEGAKIIPAIWNAASVDWSLFNLIVIRSPWDYFKHAHDFQEWIDMLDRLHLPVWNPPSVLRWNMDKRYLLDLQAKSIVIPQTHFFENSDVFDLEVVRSILRVDDVVVKPVVSASAWNTWRCSLQNFSDDDRSRLPGIPVGTGIMVQEYLPEIESDGEWSLVFFGEELSHTVRKFPGKGDFRVQQELGGRYGLEHDTPQDLILQAREIIAKVDAPLLYARVDGVVRSGKLIVMELEVLEPSLYFDVDPTAVDRFCGRLKELT